MGQAKRRGTYEARKQQAIKREAEKPTLPPISAYGYSPHKRLAHVLVAALSNSVIIER